MVGWGSYLPSSNSLSQDPYFDGDFAFCDSGLINRESRGSLTLWWGFGGKAPEERHRLNSMKVME